jgi:alpha-N-acetylglucosaminidase
MPQCRGTAQTSGVAFPLPVVNERIQAASKYRYYLNTCTRSYTMAFWNWARWEQGIDWMALQGINLPLAFTGQEAVFAEVFSGLGINESGLDQFFVGPAYLAWGQHSWVWRSP